MNDLVTPRRSDERVHRATRPRDTRLSRRPRTPRYKGVGPAGYEPAGPLHSSAAAQPRRRRRSRRAARLHVRRRHNDARTAARARSATPASSRSSRSAAISYSRLSVVPNIGGSSELTVTTTPASWNAADRVLLERGDGAGGDVRGRADLERDAGLGEVGEQRRGPARPRAVADPLGAEQPERVPDRLRAGGLAGVRDAVQPGGAGRVEVRLELRPRHADLRAAEPEADQGSGRWFSA